MSPDGPQRIWKKIATFYVLTLLFTAVFGTMDIRAPDNIILTTAIMWCPALATLATKWLFRERIRDIAWGWGSGHYATSAYFIPLLYALPVYLVVWLTGFGGFYDNEFASKVVAEYGLSSLAMPVALAAYVVVAMTAGFVAKAGRALGEEIGWRGFLVPELAKVTGFTGIGLISGLMWAAWHYPFIAFSDYNSGTPTWYAISCFTVMVVAGGFIAAWITLRSRSVWPAVIFHASHNMFIQMIFTPLTTDRGHTAYLIDEFGAGLAMTSLIAAIFVWRRRGDLDMPVAATHIS